MILHCTALHCLLVSFSNVTGIEFTKGETDKAIGAYAQAVELAPDMTPARVNLGAQLLRSGRLRDAEVVRKSHDVRGQGTCVELVCRVQGKPDEADFCNKRLR